MAQKKVVIEIVFDETLEDEGTEGEYSYHEFSSMRLLPETTMTSEDLDSIAESWAQSDWYWVGFCDSFISMLDGATIQADDVRR